MSRSHIHGTKRNSVKAFNQGPAFIITVDGQDVGYYKIESRKDCLYLADIQVLPEHQGQGIGTRLIEVLKDRAVLEAKAIRLRVLKENPASQLYQRLGFILIEQISDEFHFAMEWSP